jgi:hypothetical protein
MVGKQFVKLYLKNPTTMKRTGGVETVGDCEFMPQCRKNLTTVTFTVLTLLFFEMHAHNT